MESEVSKLLKQLNLKTRLKISIEMSTIALLADLGFIDNKMWDEDNETEMELLKKIIKFSDEESGSLLMEIKQWEIDGRPE